MNEYEPKHCNKTLTRSVCSVVYSRHVINQENVTKNKYHNNILA